MNGAKIRVIDDLFSEVTRYGTGDWDNDDTVEHHNIKGFIVIEETNEKQHSWWDFQCSIENIDWEKMYYLVYVDYDTGNSFGSEDGKVSFVDLFESRELAFVLAEAIEDNAKAYGNKNSYHTHDIKYKVDDGSERTLYPGEWLGYFEHMNDVIVKRVQRERITNGR